MCCHLPRGGNVEGAVDVLYYYYFLISIIFAICIVNSIYFIYDSFLYCVAELVNERLQIQSWIFMIKKTDTLKSWISVKIDMNASISISIK